MLSLLSFWGFTLSKFPRLVAFVNPPTLPLSLLSFLGVSTALNPPFGCLPNPRALFAFWFYDFTFRKNPRLVGFPNPQPPRFFCFLFVGFLPTPNLTGWLPYQNPIFSLLFSFGILSAPNSPAACLPNHSRFHCSLLHCFTNRCGTFGKGCYR